jgi:hypothetical protein
MSSRAAAQTDEGRDNNYILPMRPKPVERMIFRKTDTVVITQDIDLFTKQCYDKKLHNIVYNFMLII